MCKLRRGYYEEQFCEIILKLDQWFRGKCRLKDLIWSSGRPPVRSGGTIYAIMKGRIIGNIHERLFEIWTSEWFRRCRLKKRFAHDGRTDTGQRPITIAHIEPSAQVSEKIGFRSNTGPDPLKNHKATKSVFNVGSSLARQRNAMWPAFSGIWILPSTTVVKVGPPVG